MSDHTPPNSASRRQILRTVAAFSLAAAAAALAGPSAARAAEPAGADENWAQWRGPTLNGVAAPTANPPTEWGEGKNVKWKVEIPGSGTSTPIVWGDQIFLQTAINTGKKAQAAQVEPAPAAAATAQQQPAQQEQPPGRRRGGGGFGRGEKPTDVHQFVLMSIDRKTGKTLWQKAAREEVPHEGHHRDHGFASYSPVTDGQHVYAYFGSRGVHCFDLQGNAKWSKDLGRMTTRNGFGEGGSPALHGDTLVVNFDHEAGSYIVALSKATGDELWRQPRQERTSWSTPFVIEHDGVAQVVTAATGKVRSYDLKTGKVIWECGGLGSNVVPTPLVSDGMVFVMSGHQSPALLAIKLGRTGDLTGTDAVAWKLNRGTPYVPSPVLHGGRLYFFAGNNPVLSIVEAKTGKPLVAAQRVEELQGLYASPVVAGGRIYVVGRNGAAAVLKADEKGNVLATSKLDDGFDASPAVVGNELLLRGRKALYCIAEK